VTTQWLTQVKKENQIVEPPDELDGAKVIRWAWSGITPFGHLPIAGTDTDDDSCDSIEIFGLAICQYEERRSPQQWLKTYGVV
jgi:hypothetical protein